MKDLGFFLGFLVVLIIFGLVTAGSGGIFSDTATSTRERHNAASTTIRSVPRDMTPSYSSERPSRPPKRLSAEQIERRIASLYRELEQLSEALRQAKLQQPASPYTGMVELRAANARNDDPEREYLAIRANSKNQAFIDISDWYIVSLVTDESAAIPTGDRILEKWRTPVREPIELRPGEEAYLMTTESPIDVSFRENRCTGYITQYETFYPSLSRSCPRPMDEMRRFGNIALDNDTCYEFVERIGTCKTPDWDAVESDEADLNGACRNFIENTLNYNDCVTKHLTDPFFDDVGRWHIYFERDDDLWRKEREILRLMDENDLVVDVIEY